MKSTTILSTLTQTKGIYTALFMVVFFVILLMGVVVAPEVSVAVSDDQVTICHATGSESNPWNELHVPHVSTHGHFDNLGTPLSGHEEDLLFERYTECPTPTPILGSINVCKVIVDEDENIVAEGNDDATFEIPGFEFANPVTFLTPLVFNENFFGDDDVLDTQCVTYSDLEIKEYNYGEEIVTGSDEWTGALYNDQYTVSILDLDDFFGYDSDLGGNNSDGSIILTENRPNRTLVVLNTFEEPVVEDEVITINATKIVCDDESSLPNWGDSNSNTIITDNTATDFLALNDDCHLEDGWEFEWADFSTGNPGDNTGVAGGDWTTFGPTVDGVIEIEINKPDFEVVNKIWVREVMQDGYTPFTGVGITEDVSAEIYCHNDVYNYDNFDYVTDLADDETYYCVAFNALVPVVNEKPVITLIGGAVVTLTVGDTYIEQKAHVNDFEDGPIDYKLVFDNSAVNTNIAGTYFVTYNATDTENLAADEVKREVKVNDPVPKPECSDGDDNDGDNLTDIADPGCHTDGNPDNPDSYDPTDDDETHIPPYANYCGDGIVNQEWESCDTEAGLTEGVQCTAQCQFDNQCIEKSFARVNVNEYENHSNGDITDDIFLGSAANKIPMGMWFLLYSSGTYVSDADILGYEDVPGLAVERQEGSVRVVDYGSHERNDGSKEHINGDVEFFNFSVIGQRSDVSGNNKLEGENLNNIETKGSMDNMPGDDEVWLEDQNDTQSFFWLTTTTADDGFYSDYSDDVPMCEQPNTPPVIHIIGDQLLLIEINHTYTDPGSTATDAEDDDTTLTNAIVVGGDTVDPSTVGSYFVTYDVTDSGGLDAETATRTVTVYDDSEPAVCNDGYDNDEDELTDAEDPGCWTDPEDPQTYDINGDSENEKPVITRTGDNVRVVIGTSYTDEGATAYDPEDEDITDDIVTTGTTTVDVNTTGIYTIRYNVTDGDGEDADEVTREVEVYNPSINPVCTSNCGGGGGGGPVPNNLKIFNEKITVIGEGTALITWETNKPADSRVVYDDDSHTLGVATLTFGTGSENLDYEFTTETVDSLVLEHSVLVTNVNLEDLFFFRPLSSDGTRAIGIELEAVLGFVTPGTCSQYLFEFIRFGSDNDTEEVRKLQVFLNEFEGNNLEVTGIYDVATFDAVVVFQNKYNGDVLSPWGLQTDTGYVYLTTRKKINEIYCNFQLAFPLSASQLAEVNDFKTLLEQLQATGQPLPDTSNVGFAPTAPTFAGGNVPNVTLTEESSDDEGALASEDDEGADSLAAAVEAVEGRGFFSRIGNFFKGLFR